MTIEQMQIMEILFQYLPIVLYTVSYLHSHLQSPCLEIAHRSILRQTKKYDFTSNVSLFVGGNKTRLIDDICCLSPQI